MKNNLKKSTLSLLLCLCMALTLLPAMAMAEGNTTTTTAVEDAIFNYAYDVYRTPNFPAKGGTIKMYNFDKPLKAGSTYQSSSRYESNNGVWTLDKVGAYSTIANPSAILKSVVGEVEKEYNNISSTGDIIVHELFYKAKADEKNKEHVAYGVILAYDNGSKAFFLGDNWNGGGAGYLLSVSQIINETQYKEDYNDENKSKYFEMTASMVATDYINPTETPEVTPEVTPATSTGSGVSLWYNGGNSFGSSRSAVPTAVEIDGAPVSFTGTGSSFTVSCVPAGAKWVTVRWNSTTVTTNFTPDANASCSTVAIPKTGDMTIAAYAVMAVIAAAGAMLKK